MIFKIITLSLALVGLTEAACPNQCSGHGTCGVDEVCTCYPGWGMNGAANGDCSDRFCPYELSWVDEPSSNGLTHKYSECANKGFCNRENGECDCFEGYEGKGCGRQTCPTNCSGHGTCEYMKDLTYGIVYNEYYNGASLSRSGLGHGAKKFENTVDHDYSWDTERARACVCDGGWTGIACNQRMCMMGNDIMDVIPLFDENLLVDENGMAGMTGHGNEVAQVQTITLYDSSAVPANGNFASKSFALQFTSKLNETYATQPIMWDAVSDGDFATDIELALEKLPNKVIDDVKVSVDSSDSAAGVIIDVTFKGAAVQGKQHKLEVLQDKCDTGCTPKITGLTNIRTFHSTTLSTVIITTTGSHNTFECGRRGKCDHSTGLCKCFEGFTGETCSILTALV